MGRSMYESFSVAKEAWDQADKLLGFPISRVAFDGPEEDLKLTRHAQLALYVSEVAGMRVLQGQGVQPAFSAGHSIGEYAALVCAGALSFQEGLRLVSVRAGAMDRAAGKGPGSMAAVLGLDAAHVGEVLQKVSAGRVLGIANLNSPQQIVISGESAAVKDACEALSAEGARRVVPLAVSGGFHSPLMEEAAEELAQALESAEVVGSVIPVALNVSAEFASGAEEVRRGLARQVVSQVRWHESMQRVLAAGADALIEIGPGRVLTGLARRMDGAENVAAFNVEEAGDVSAVVAEFAAA